ncbi:MAG: phosphotransferase [Methanoregulaceae archaeon]|nr:phosphotransferase [Methanoregulaceae archaeon]
MAMWDADIEIDVGIAHTAIIGQFPEFAVEQPTVLGEGWDNLCVVYPSGIAFRFPRRKTAIALIGVEVAVLPLIAPRLPLPIPVPVYSGAPGPAYPHPFSGYRLLPGETMDRAPIRDPADGAEVLGAFLGCLHRLDPRTLPLPGDHIHRKDPERIRERFVDRWNAIPSVEQARWGTVLPAWVHETATTVKPTEKACVVHGDLYPRHVLVQEGVVAGVIDWGDVHLGHPAMDLSLMVTGFDAEHWPGFLRAYGQPISEEDLRHARLRASMYGAALLAYGLDTSDDAIAACGRKILDRVVR